MLAVVRYVRRLALRNKTIVFDCVVKGLFKSDVHFANLLEIWNPPGGLVNGDLTWMYVPTSTPISDNPDVETIDYRDNQMDEHVRKEYIDR